MKTKLAFVFVFVKGLPTVPYSAHKQKCFSSDIVSLRTVLCQSNMIRKVKSGIFPFFISDEECSMSDDVMAKLSTTDF